MLSVLANTDDFQEVSTRDGKPGAVMFDIRGSFTATAVFEGCINLAATTPVWTAIGAKKLIDETIVASVSAAAIVAIPCSGFEAVRCRLSAATAQTVNVESSPMHHAGVKF